jgi:cytidylate kinase
MAIITISRGTFSGGKELAERLAERLGYPCISREEVLSETTKEYGISEADLTSAMEKTPSFWFQVPSQRLAYLKCVTSILLDHAKEGKLVYHGHAGHLLLSGIPYLIRIRLIADKGFRTKAAMERMNLNQEEASAYIEKIDRQRHKWAQFLYGIDWEDAHLYDAVFNIERVSITGICDLVIRMAELSAFSMTDQAQLAFKDFALGSRVWANLAKNKRTRSASINVVAHDGIVTITGSVGSDKTVEAITQAAREVEGVKSVQNEVGVGSDWYW